MKVFRSSNVVASRQLQAWRIAAHRGVVFCVIVASLLAMGFTTPAEAQTLSPIFPAEGVAISANELITKGFEWTAPSGATAFSLVIEKSGILPQTIGPFSTRETRLQLTQEQRNAIGDGRYFWRVTITEGEGAGTASPWFTMIIMLPGQHLIPTATPTPVVPTPTPWPGPGRINALDLFSFASAWRQTSAEPGGNSFDLTGDNSVNAGDLSLFIRRYGQVQPSPTPTPPSADWSGSGRIDSQDLFVFSSAWKRSEVDSSVTPFDLNRDGVIDEKDLLLFNAQFGRAVPAPSPTPSVGVPRNLSFTPGANVQVNQLSVFRIHWDAPAFPIEAAFRYEILVYSLAGYRNYIDDITENSIVPFPSGYAPEGNYSVFLRAQADGVGDSAIAVGSFSVERSQGGITPTPRPSIDPELPAPRWVEVSVDPENISGFKDQGCVDELSPPRLIPLPLEGDLVYVVDLSSRRCRFFEMMASRFYFEPAANAVGYEYRFTDEGGISYGPFSTLGATYAQIPPQPPRPPHEVKIYEVTARARFADNRVSDWGRTLTILMPYSASEN